jgi:hypothetical protein
MGENDKDGRLRASQNLIAMVGSATPPSLVPSFEMEDVRPLADYIEKWMLGKFESPPIIHDAMTLYHWGDHEGSLEERARRRDQ